MHATQVLNVLVVALSTIGAAQALKMDSDYQIYNGDHAKQVVRRQKTTGEPAVTGKTGQGTNTSPTATSPSSSTSTPPTTSTPPPTSSKQTFETTPTSSNTPSSEPSETTPPTTSPTVSSTPPPTTRTSSTSSPPESTTTSTTSSSTTAKVVVSTSTTVVTTTGANGQSTTYTSEQVSTTTPDLARTGSSGSTGMTPQTRNTVIGVVVGIGGAVVLAGVAFLALRLYRRNRQPDESDDGLMEYSSGGVVSAAAGDKSEVASSGGFSQTGRSPFQSTLESYHAPTQVNTASNF